MIRISLVACLLCAACVPRVGASTSSSSGGEVADAGIEDAGTAGSSSSSSSGGALGMGALGTPCMSAADCTAVTAAASCEVTLGAEPVAGGVCVGTQCTEGEPCEGGQGKCLTNGLVRQCVLACFGAGTCPRDGFSCFNAAGVGQVCLPTTRSECSPINNLGCENGEGCQRAGPDDVGVCISACSPELQDCPPQTDGGPAQGCFFSSTTPFCSVPNNPQPDYAPCSTTNACAVGRTCVQIYDQPRCYFTCNHEGSEPRCAEGRCQPLFQGHLCVVDEPVDAGM